MEISGRFVIPRGNFGESSFPRGGLSGNRHDHGGGLKSVTTRKKIDDGPAMALMNAAPAQRRRCVTQ